VHEHAVAERLNVHIGHRAVGLYLCWVVFNLIPASA
jgi:hypothetical protein